MPRLGAVVLGDKPARFAVEAFEKEINDYMKRRVKPEVKKRLEKQVANFSADNRPDFRVRVYAGPNPALKSGYGIVLEAWPTGKAAELWRMLSKGAEEHKIPLQPKGEGDWLIYQRDYAPKTKVLGDGLSVGGKGAYSGPIVRKKQVTHPGFKARRWTYYLMEEYRPTWEAHTDGVIKEAMRAARRAR